MSTIFVYLGWGIVGVAMSTFVVYAVYGLGFTILSACFAFIARADIARFLGQVFTPFLAMIFPLVLGALIIPAGDGFRDEALCLGERIALMAVVLSSALWWTNRDGKVMAVLREEFSAYLISVRRHK